MTVFVAILLSVPGADLAYRVDAPLAGLVDEIRLSDLSPASPLVSDMVPVLRSLPQVLVTVTAIPTGRDRRYEIQIDLQQSVSVPRRRRSVTVDRLRVRLVLEPDDASGTTWVESQVDVGVDLRIGCALVDRIVERFVNEAERAILQRGRVGMDRLAGEVRDGDD